MLTFDTVRHLLPQQFPLLMVDRVVAHEAYRSICTLKNISGNDLLLTGHFPDRAIFPGALLLEGMAQSAILLYKLSTQVQEDEFYLFGSVKARFIQPVYPGDQVLYTVELGQALTPMMVFRGEATVERKPVARGELVMMVEPASRKEA